MASMTLDAVVCEVTPYDMVVEISSWALEVLSESGILIYGTKGLVNSSTEITPPNPHPHQPWTFEYAKSEKCQILNLSTLDGYDVRGCQWIVCTLVMRNAHPRIKGVGIWMAFRRKARHTKGRIRTPECSKGDMVCYPRAFQSRQEFTDCRSGTLVRFF
ncbi:MAG: hypothetical protein GY816_08335, partial [Cytophagales bacterium]|nr:hypothetical protein [Cytophagales bacterium]